MPKNDFFNRNKRRQHGHGKAPWLRDVPTLPKAEGKEKRLRGLLVLFLLEDFLYNLGLWIEVDIN